MMQAYKSSAKKFPDVISFDEATIDKTKEYIFAVNISMSGFWGRLDETMSSAISAKGASEEMIYFGDDKIDPPAEEVCFDQTDYSHEEFLNIINLYAEAMECKIILADGDVIIMEGNQQIFEDLEGYCDDSFCLYLENAAHVSEFIAYERNKLAEKMETVLEPVKRENHPVHLRLLPQYDA